MTTTADTLVDNYLRDLKSELRDLPAPRQREILAEVGEHITEARAAQDTQSEAAIRTVLERLGDPADIAAEARERFGVQAEPTKPATPWLEVITLVALVVPFLGWVVGAVLVWLSRRWTTRDKLIGTIGGLSWVVAGLGTVMEPAGSGGPSLGSTVLIGVVIAGFVLPYATAIYLAIRLRAGTNTVPATR
jgi:Protein of unknown function (DUF1700)